MATTQTKTKLRYATIGVVGLIAVAAFAAAGVVSGVGGLILLATTVCAGRMRMLYTVLGAILGVVVLIAGFGSISYDTAAVTGSGIVSADA